MFKRLSVQIALNPVSKQPYRKELRDGERVYFYWFPLDCFLLEVMPNRNGVSVWTCRFIQGCRTELMTGCHRESLAGSENTVLSRCLPCFLQVCLSSLHQTLTACAPSLLLFKSLVLFFPTIFFLSMLHFSLLLLHTTCFLSPREAVNKKKHTVFCLHPTRSPSQLSSPSSAP